MARGTVRKVTILAVILFALVFIPDISSVGVASRIHPTAIYEPAMSASGNSTPSMPFPTPTLGYVPEPAPVSSVLRILIIAAAFSDINETVSTTTIKLEYFGQTP